MPKRKSSAADTSEESPKKRKKVQAKEEGPKKAKKVKAKEEKLKEKASAEQGSSKETTAEKQVLKTTTEDGRTGNLKIVSWNCAGLKAWAKKNGVDYIKEEDGDIVCLQETKCEEKDAPSEVHSVKAGGLSFSKDDKKGYHMYWDNGEQKGYSGTTLWSKTKPIKVTYGLGIKEHDNEGRLITAEYEKFYMVTSYVPNAGRGLVRLDYRQKWDKDLREYLKKLDEKKPVIFCGDLNVAHEEIDIANPKSNKKNAGFTQEERQGFTDLLNAGFVDSFRHLYPDKAGAYSFWTYMGNARAKNVGWRLDYFVISKALVPNLCDSIMRSSVLGSDHCPIVLMLHI